MLAHRFLCNVNDTGALIGPGSLWPNPDARLETPVMSSPTLYSPHNNWSHYISNSFLYLRSYGREGVKFHLLQSHARWININHHNPITVLTKLFPQEDSHHPVQIWGSTGHPLRPAHANYTQRGNQRDRDREWVIIFKSHIKGNTW